MTGEEIKNIYREIIKGNMQDDILMVEDEKRMPIMGVEYRIQYIYMGLCIKGFCKGQYDYQDYCFKAGDICWLLPNHIMRHDEVSEDYSVLSLFINPSYYQNLSLRGRLPRHYYPFFVTSISLDPPQFDLMCNGFHMLGRLAAVNHPQRDDLICKMCDVLAILGDEFIMQKNPAIGGSQKHFVQLFESFYKDIVLHYRESREIAFYAKLQSLTPKYFATVIKQTTGRSAGQWINNYVNTQAKWMLQHEHGKTVQQIACQLGFSEQASFSRFFKTNSGKSPTEFRDMV